MNHLEIMNKYKQGVSVHSGSHSAFANISGKKLSER